MQILEVAEGVILSRPDSFNMNQIITSGQCFRWDEIKTNVWRGVAFDTLLEIELLDDNSYLFKCTKETFYSLWYDYFDFERDYEQIKRSVSGDSFLEKAVVVGDGIRILRQDPFEMLITFIISQCSNIPKIKTNVNILCQKLGAYVEDKHGKDGYYLFPTPKDLAENPELIASCGVGYRDKYIVNAARKVLTGELNLDHLRTVSREEAFDALVSLYGVGRKVANCVLLFGLQHLDGFPIDLWIKKVLDKHYQGLFDTSRYNGYRGVIQQYMFYYGRTLGASYFE